MPYKNQEDRKNWLRRYRITHFEYREYEREMNKERNRINRGYYDHPNRIKPKYSRLHTLDKNGNHVYITIAKRPKPKQCELCNKKKNRLVWHHWGEPQLGWGTWVCSPCHMAIEQFEIFGEDVIIKIKNLRTTAWKDKIDVREYQTRIQKSKNKTA